MDDFAFHQARQFGSVEGYGVLAQLLEALRRRVHRAHSGVVSGRR